MTVKKISCQCYFGLVKGTINTFLEQVIRKKQKNKTSSKAIQKNNPEKQSSKSFQQKNIPYIGTYRECLFNLKNANITDVQRLVEDF